MAQSSVQGEGTFRGVPHTREPERDGGPGGRRHGRQGSRGPRRGRRVLRWSATTLSVLILGTAGAGYLYYQHLNGNIQKGKAIKKLIKNWTADHARI